MNLRSRQRGQAIVEFGIIALLFVALMFAVVDFGLLLNTWVSVTSGAREIGRNASVGKNAVFLQDEASRISLPSVDFGGFGSRCCGSSAAVSLTVEYFNCMPSSTCSPLPAAQIFNAYGGSLADGTPGGHPAANDFTRITLVAQGAQVITPLMRPFFGCTNGANPHCYVPLTGTAILRYEGAEF